MMKHGKILCMGYFLTLDRHKISKERNLRLFYNSL